jgi:hypothetical protein
LQLAIFCFRVSQNIGGGGEFSLQGGSYKILQIFWGERRENSPLQPNFCVKNNKKYKLCAFKAIFFRKNVFALKMFTSQKIKKIIKFLLFFHKERFFQKMPKTVSAPFSGKILCKIQRKISYFWRNR